MYNLCLIQKLCFKNRVRVSESTSSYITGKVKLTETKKTIYIFLLYFSVLQFSSNQSVSMAGLGCNENNIKP